MKQIGKATAAAVIALGALALVGAPVFADASHDAAGGGVQLAHMGGGQGMGPGMMGPGQGMGHGMMGQGMMGQGMMSYGYGMMGPETMTGAAHGTPPCTGAVEGAVEGADRDLGVDDVRAKLERHLEWRGNERLKVGDVTQTDDDTIVAEIVTVDDSLVEKLTIDRHSGRMQRIN